MGLFDFFRKQKNFSYVGTGLLTGGVSSDISSLEDAAIKNPYVNRALTLRAQAISDLEWEIVNGDKPNQKLMSWFANPVSLTPRQFLQKIQYWRDITGVAFIRKSFPQPELLDSDRVSLVVTPSMIKVIYMRAFGTDTYDISEVALITGQSPFVRIIKDVSPLLTVLEDAKAQYRQMEVLSNMFQNGAFLNIILATEDHLTKDQVQMILDQIREKYSSPQNSGKIMLLSNSRWEVHDIKANPNDFGLKDTDEFEMKRIAVAFGIPSVFFNDMQGVNRAVAQTQEYIFEKYVTKPLANDLAEQITAKLLDNKAEFRFKFTENLSLEDQQLLAQIREIELRSGLKYINEFRQEDGLDPVPWGNQWWGNLSMTPLGTANPQPNPETAKILEKLEKIERKLDKKDKSVYREQIWKSYVAMTEPMEKRLAKEVMDIFKKQEKEVLKQLEALKSKSDIEKKDTLRPQDIVAINISEEWKDYIVKHLKPFLLSFMQQAGDKVLNDLGFGISFNLQVPGIQEKLMKSLEKSASEIIQTTRKDVYDQLLEGIQNGEGIPELANRMKTLFEETYKNRSETIARTETISATNYAGLEAAKQVGITKKQWLTSADERVRPTHAAADGQIRNIDEPFNVGNDELMFPGDKNGSPEEIINCRCTIILMPEEGD
jgi:HK97 family phage portal protein